MYRFIARIIVIFSAALVAFFSVRIKRDGKTVWITSPMRLRLFLENAGGAFIKFGQILSLRNDLLPYDYTDELLHLLTRVPALSFEQMEKVFMAEFHKPPEIYFRTFDPHPLSSASLAQVYHATLKTGEDVVVKIRRPETKEVFEVDFAIVSFIAGLFGVFSLARNLQINDIVSEFIAWTRHELDFRNEAINGNALYNHSQKHPLTVVPKIYMEHSSESVVVSQYIHHAILLETFLIRNNHTLTEHSIPDSVKLLNIANYLIADMMRQVFIDGFFHADPHPGNLFVLPDNKIGYFDFGLIGKATTRRLALAKFAHAVAYKNTPGAANSFLEYAHQLIEEEARVVLKDKKMGTKKYGRVLEKIKELISLNFEEGLSGILSEWWRATETRHTRNKINEDDIRQGLAESSSSFAFAKIMLLVRTYGFYLPREVVVFFRALSIVDMISLHLHPSFTLTAAMKKFFDECPISRIEEIIEKETHEKELSDSRIEPIIGENFEQMLELRAIEQERVAISKERLAETIAYYAERYPEVQKELSK